MIGTYWDPSLYGCLELANKFVVVGSVWFKPILVLSFGFDQAEHKFVVVLLVGGVLMQIWWSALVQYWILKQKRIGKYFWNNLFYTSYT